MLRQHALDPFRTSIAIANCLYGVQLLFSEDMGAGFARAVNDWMAAEWLDKEPRLRASIVVPAQSPEHGGGRDQPRRARQAVRPGAAAGDERHAAGQAALLADLRGGAKHGLTVGIHAGSAYRHPVTPVGWPSYYTEDYAAQAAAFPASACHR